LESWWPLTWKKCVWNGEHAMARLLMAKCTLQLLLVVSLGQRMFGISKVVTFLIMQSFLQKQCNVESWKSSWP